MPVLFRGELLTMGRCANLCLYFFTCVVKVTSEWVGVEVGWGRWVGIQVGWGVGVGWVGG